MTNWSTAGMYMAIDFICENVIFVRTDGVMYVCLIEKD